MSVGDTETALRMICGIGSIGMYLLERLWGVSPRLFGGI
jgi:hypothetical protein